MMGLRKWFGTTSLGQGSLPAGKRAYAVGDVHGRADLLDQALHLIDRDTSNRGSADTKLIFLGDLIDRGPDSAKVVDRVRLLAAERKVVTLAGNHEEVLLRILRGQGGLIPDWLRFGGAECAASYGVDVSRLRRMNSEDAVTMLNAAVPKTHKEFLEGLGDTYQLGGYLFVHAGIRPGVPLAEQTQTDLRWIRGPFLSCTESHEHVVVHGHTISAEPERLSNRIGIDTGAYRSGILTVLGLEGADQWILQTGVTEPDIVSTVSDLDVAEASERC